MNEFISVFKLHKTNVNDFKIFISFNSNVCVSNEEQKEAAGCILTFSCV